MKFRAHLVLALALSALPARAQEVNDRARGAARQLAEDGVSALQAGDTNTAVDKLERAYQIVRLPTVGLWSARALVKAGRLVSASERYVDVTHWSGASGDVHAQDQAKAAAARERDELLPRIPSVTIGIDGAKASEVAVTLDGEPVLPALIGTAVPTDPKHHVVHGTRGTETAEEGFDVAEGQKASVTLKFGGAQPAVAAAPATPATPLPPATPPPATDTGTSKGPSFWNTQRVVGVTLGGAGIAAGVVSLVFTASALSKKSDADAFCKEGACTSQRGVDLLSDARSAGTVATITGIAGLALAGAGVVLFFTAPSTHREIALSPAYLTGGGGLVAGGTF